MEDQQIIMETKMLQNPLLFHQMQPSAQEVNERFNNELEELTEKYEKQIDDYEEVIICLSVDKNKRTQ
jgi:menaquinone-dependent protoporphyrinogen IX oxidase